MLLEKVFVVQDNESLAGVEIKAKMKEPFDVLLGDELGAASQTAAPVRKSIGCGSLEGSNHNSVQALGSGGSIGSRHECDGGVRFPRKSRHGSHAAMRAAEANDIS